MDKNKSSPLKSDGSLSSSSEGEYSWGQCLAVGV